VGRYRTRRWPWQAPLFRFSSAPSLGGGGVERVPKWVRLYLPSSRPVARALYMRRSRRSRVRGSSCPASSSTPANQSATPYIVRCSSAILKSPAKRCSRGGTRRREKEYVGGASGKRRRTGSAVPPTAQITGGIGSGIEAWRVQGIQRRNPSARPGGAARRSPPCRPFAPRLQPAPPFSLSPRRSCTAVALVLQAW